MAHKTISDAEVMAKAMELFRTFGFEGVSLKQLADAMGLEKASLYYRFPGGKDEIALAVARAVEAAMQERIFAPLGVGSATPRRRLTVACDCIREFYGGGTKSCIFDLLSITGAAEEVKQSLRGTMRQWLDAFAGVAKESGLTAAQARARAEEAIVRIEGGLVLSRVLGEPTAFERALKAVPELLTAA